MSKKKNKYNLSELLFYYILFLILLHNTAMIIYISLRFDYYLEFYSQLQQIMLDL